MLRLLLGFRLAFLAARGSSAGARHPDSWSTTAMLVVAVVDGEAWREPAIRRRDAEHPESAPPSQALKRDKHCTLESAALIVPSAVLPNTTFFCI